MFAVIIHITEGLLFVNSTLKIKYVTNLLEKKQKNTPRAAVN